MSSDPLMGREEIGPLQGLDLHVLDQAAQLGDGVLLLVPLTLAATLALMPLPNSPRKLQPPMPGPPGLWATRVFHHWVCFFREEARNHFLKLNLHT